MDIWTLSGKLALRLLSLSMGSVCIRDWAVDSWRIGPHPFGPVGVLRREARWADDDRRKPRPHFVIELRPLGGSLSAAYVECRQTNQEIMIHFYRFMYNFEAVG